MAAWAAAAAAGSDMSTVDMVNVLCSSGGEGRGDRKEKKRACKHCLSRRKKASGYLNLAQPYLPCGVLEVDIDASALKELALVYRQHRVGQRSTDITRLGAAKS